MCLKRIHFSPAHISANLTKLESDFIAKGGKWKEFTIGNLFESENGDFDIQKTHLNNKGYSVVSSGIENCGIIGKTDIEAKIFPRHTLTCDMFGNVFYREFDYKMVTHARVFSLKFLDENFNNKSALYVATTMNYLKSKFSYSNMCSFKKIQDMSILLPTQDDKIAFDFMESFIKELELERIKELEAYLQATGLNNYELTDKEKQALDIFGNIDCTHSPSITNGQFYCSPSRSTSGARGWVNLQWQEFRIGDLFSVKSNPQLNKDSFIFRENGQYPYFTRTVLNNGIAGYVDYLDEAHKIKGGGLAVGMLGMQFFYMEKDFYAGQFTKTCYPKFENFNKQIAYFFIAWLNKNQKVFQGVLVRDFEKVFNDTKIKLPTNKDGQIAFDFMESFISAVQKEVIRGVNLWSEKRIQAAKQSIL